MELLELLRTRRTYRRFDQSKSVPQEVLTDMLEALRLASSGRNNQILHYVVVEQAKLIEQIMPLTRWAGALPVEEGQPKEGEYPTLMVFVTYPKVKQSATTELDMGLAISNMTLAAWNYGVGSCILRNINYPEIRKILNLSEEMELHCLVAFGYPTHKSVVVDLDNPEAFAYYLDADKNYIVPKLKVEDIVTKL